MSGVTLSADYDLCVQYVTPDTRATTTTHAAMRHGPDLPFGVRHASQTPAYYTTSALSCVRRLGVGSRDFPSSSFKHWARSYFAAESRRAGTTKRAKHHGRKQMFVVAAFALNVCVGHWLQRSVLSFQQRLTVIDGVLVAREEARGDPIDQTSSPLASLPHLDLTQGDKGLYVRWTSSAKLQVQ